MKRFLRQLCGLVSIAALLGVSSPLSVTAATVNVVANSDGPNCSDGGHFSPSSVTINDGDTVTFSVPASDPYPYGIQVNGLPGGSFVIAKGGQHTTPALHATVGYNGTWPSSGCPKGSGTITVKAAAVAPAPAPTPSPSPSATTTKTTPTPPPAAVAPNPAATTTPTPPEAGTTVAEGPIPTISSSKAADVKSSGSSWLLPSIGLIAAASIAAVGGTLAYRVHHRKQLIQFPSTPPGAQPPTNIPPPTITPSI